MENEKNPWDIKPVRKKIVPKVTKPVVKTLKDKLKDRLLNAHVDGPLQNSSNITEAKNHVLSKLNVETVSKISENCVQESPAAPLSSLDSLQNVTKSSFSVDILKRDSLNLNSSIFGKCTNLQTASVMRRTTADAVKPCLSRKRSTFITSDLDCSVFEETAASKSSPSREPSSKKAKLPQVPEEFAMKPKADIPCDIQVKNAQEPTSTCVASEAEEETKKKSTWKVVSSTSRAAPMSSDQNFIKLNFKQKCFSKGGSRRQRMLKAQFKRGKYNAKFGKSSKGGEHYGRDQSASMPKDKKCFRCGFEGHWASKCPQRFTRRKKPQEEEFNPDEALAAINRGAELRLLSPADMRGMFPEPSADDFLASDGDLPRIVEPLCDGTERRLPSAVKLAVGQCLTELGIKQFRIGQELAVWRVLCGQSTVVVLPTGAGKSLCYQLPAMVYNKLRSPCVALVVSPLISLMQDQIASKTLKAHGAFLNSSQTYAQREEILAKARQGEYSFLLVSPEALVESDWLFQKERLPPISFACVDEAHCLADWSHHFRPAYLRVCQLLRRRLGVRSFLALSATCTRSTLRNVCRNLGMPSPRHIRLGRQEEELLDGLQGDGFLQPFEAPLPDHLHISASMERDRDEALLQLLTRAPFVTLPSVLVYAATRDQTERLAGFVRTALRDRSVQVGRRRLTWDAAAYHAGQTAAERARVQRRFMEGRLRVVVATSAFGMGVDKRDLQAVVHYALPKSFENYVQEAGRVGRSGQEAFCHAFLSEQVAGDPCEANELRRHVFVNSLDAVFVKRFLFKLFDCKGPLQVIVPEKWAEELDIAPESLGTLLAYLDLWEERGKLISVLSPGHATARVECYGGASELARVSERSLAVAAWLGRLAEEQGLGFDASSTNAVQLDLARLCGLYGWRVAAVKSELQKLQWDRGETDPVSHQTGVKVTYSDWAWWVFLHEARPSDQVMDTCIQYLLQRLRSVEQSGLRGVSQLNRVLNSVASDTLNQVFPQLEKEEEKEAAAAGDKEVSEKSLTAHRLIKQYFAAELPEEGNQQQQGEKEEEADWPLPVTEAQQQSVRSTIRTFLHMHGANLAGQITGRALANVLHGIGSPAFPAITWASVKRFWRAHLDVDWPTIKRWATEEIIQARIV